MIECPGCGGNLKFNIPTQMMHCDFCDNNYDPYDFDAKSEDGIEVKDYETTVFTCPECAGEISSTDNEITGFCPFCGASTIFYSRMEKEMKPNYIIPFMVSKDDCKKAYINKAKKMIFMPKSLKNIEYIDGFRGIYTPYWSYDVDMYGGTILKAEKTHRHGDYIHHDHYDLCGEMNSFYHGVTHDASSSFSDDISARIAPFDVKGKKKFTAGFLSGFYADQADVSAELYKAPVFNMVKSNAMSKAKKMFPGYSVKSSGHNIPIKMAEPQRTLFPVWFMSYRYNDRVAYATVNGQTGKVAADFPISIGRFLGISAILSVLIFIILNMLFTLKPTTVSLLTAIIAIIAAILYAIEWNNIKRRDNNIDDLGYNSVNKQASSNIKKLTMPVLPEVISLVCAGLAGIMFFIHTIHDYLHYGVSLISAIGIGYTMICLVKDYNILATRRLPQFDRKGGDDNA